MKPSSILFILDDFHPIRHAPAVRIQSFLRALEDLAPVLLAGSSEAIAPGTFPFRVEAVMKPPPTNPLRRGAFIFELGARACLFAAKERPKCVVLSVPKYELLMFLPILRMLSDKVVVDFRDSLGFVDYEAYLSHFFPGALARLIGKSYKAVVSAATRIACRNVDLMTTANDAISETLREFSRPTITLSNGVDTEVFSTKHRPAEQPLPTAPLRIGYMGNFAEKDRFDILMEAVEGIESSIHIDLFGFGRNKYNILRTFDQKRIAYTDHGHVHHNEIPERFSHINIGIIFRDEFAKESVPVAIYEMCALGIPVIVNDVGIMARTVQQHGLGWVINTAQGLRNILDEILERPEKLREFSHLSPLAVEEFSRKKQAKKMRQALLDLIG